MDRALLKRILQELPEIGLPDYVPRETRPSFMRDLVTSIVGGRKVGKTYLTYQVIDAAIREGRLPSIDHVCYLHFDDERLLEMRREDLQLIDSTFQEISGLGPGDPILFVFDEIHRIEGWEYFALRLNRNPNWSVLVTGSTAELEEDSIGRQLRGKTLTCRLLPLSFREYLRFGGIDWTQAIERTSGRAELRRAVHDYLENGSYPGVFGLSSDERLIVLQQYFNSIVAADFLERRRIVHPRACKLYLKDLLARNANQYTHKKERNALASMGYKIPPATIADWFSWAVEAYAIGVCTINSPSVKKQEQNYRKLYAADWALAHSVVGFREARQSRALEAAVYWELRRRGMSCQYALTGPSKYEVDFVAGPTNAPPRLAVQVCMSLSDPDVRERERRALQTLRSFDDGIETIIVALSGVRDAPEIAAVDAVDWLLREP